MGSIQWNLQLPDLDVSFLGTNDINAHFGSVKNTLSLLSKVILNLSLSLVAVFLFESISFRHIHFLMPILMNLQSLLTTNVHCRE